MPRRPGRRRRSGPRSTSCWPTAGASDRFAFRSGGDTERSRKSVTIFERVVANRAVVTSARAAAEVRGVLQDKPDLAGDAGELAEALLAGILVVDEAVYAELLDSAAQVLARAVPSRDASTRDAHLLACAWVFDADLWSHDRDFAGTGWPSWSNANLNNRLDSNPT